MRALGMMTGFALGCWVLIGDASAQSRSIYGIADDYRDAVSDFEDHAKHLPQIDQLTLRVIDDLEDAAGDLRSAARRPEQVDRLLANFNKVEILQQRVEGVVFASRCPIIAAELGPCWNEVLTRFALIRSLLVGAPGCGVGGAPYPAARYPVADPWFNGRVSSPLPPYTSRNQTHSHVDPRFAYPSHNPVSPFPSAVPSRGGDLGAAVLSSILNSALRRNNR